jgi:hypothetical protein
LPVSKIECGGSKLNDPLGLVGTPQYRRGYFRTAATAAISFEPYLGYYHGIIEAIHINVGDTDCSVTHHRRVLGAGLQSPREYQQNNS